MTKSTAAAAAAGGIDVSYLSTICHAYTPSQRHSSSAIPRIEGKYLGPSIRLLLSGEIRRFRVEVRGSIVRGKKVDGEGV